MNENATPENTPIPGGGTWAWDTSSRTWVSLDEMSQALDEISQAPQHANTSQPENE